MNAFFLGGTTGRALPCAQHSRACQRRALLPARHTFRVTAEQQSSGPAQPPGAPRPGQGPQRRAPQPQQQPQRQSSGPPQQRPPQSSPGGPPQQRPPAPRSPGGPPVQRAPSGPSGPSGPSQPGPPAARSPSGAPQQRPSGAPSRPFPGSAPRRPPGSFQRTPYQRPAGGSRPSNPRNDRRGPPRVQGPLINEDIRASEIRLLGGDKTMLGVMPLTRALDMADEEDADVILISSESDPPLCRLLPLDKFKYEQGKADREQKKKQRENRQDTKELKLRPGTDVHDYDVRVRSAQKFISKGDKVKVTLQFKGREMSFRDTSREMMMKFVKDTGEEAVLLQDPKIQGRQMQMIMGPKVSSAVNA